MPHEDANIGISIYIKIDNAHDIVQEFHRYSRMGECCCKFYFQLFIFGPRMVILRQYFNHYKSNFFIYALKLS